MRRYRACLGSGYGHESGVSGISWGVGLVSVI